MSEVDKESMAEQRKDESWGREVLLKLCLILSKLLMRKSIWYTTSMGKWKEMVTTRTAQGVSFQEDKFKRRLFKQSSTRGTLLTKPTLNMGAIITAPCGGKGFF